MKIALLILAFAVSAFSQLPEYGTLDEIKGKSKIYVIAEGESRTAILKQIGKHKAVSLANKPDEAEIFVEYKTVSRGLVPPSGMTLETGELNAFISPRKIVWTKSKTAGGFKGDTANGLIKDFLKALSKLK